MELIKEEHHVPRINDYNVHSTTYSVINKSGDLCYIRDLQQGDYGYVYTHNYAGRIITIFEMKYKVSETDYIITLYNLRMDYDERDKFISSDIERSIGALLRSHADLEIVLDRMNWACL